MIEMKKVEFMLGLILWISAIFAPSFIGIPTTIYFNNIPLWQVLIPLSRYNRIDSNFILLSFYVIFLYVSGTYMMVDSFVSDGYVNRRSRSRIQR